MKWKLSLVVVLLLLLAGHAFAAGPGAMSDQPATVLAGVLALLMPAGFALLATGLCRLKNAAHTIFLTLLGSALALTAFWICGFALSTGGHFLLRGRPFDAGMYGQFFALVPLVVVTACIPIGALAERWSLRNFCLATLVLAGVFWPIFVRWSWSDGWLRNRGFVDVAGSGTVHALAGLWALAGTVVLGPRRGRYNKLGLPAPLPAHNVPFALLGSFLLATGWLGFNLLRATSEPALTATTTVLAGAGGALAAALYMTWQTRRPDPTIVANGLLAGLVASSAAAGLDGPTASFVTGAVAGVLVCWSIKWLDRLHVDDPVGVVGVHGMGGLWGLIACGVLHRAPLGAQLIGCATLVVWGFGVAWVFFKLLNRLVPMRVAPEDELEGLDISEVGVIGYPDIQGRS